MSRELIFFHRGLAHDVRPAMQDVGFLQVAENISFEEEGVQKLRPRYAAINTTAINAAHSIRRFLNNLLVGDSTYLRWRSALATGDFTSLGAGFASAIWSFDEYKDFLHGVNGTDKVLFDASGNLYPANVENPSAQCVGAAGAAGNPNDTYALYCSFFITWPNGHTYETGLSPVSADVTVVNQKIDWSGIPVSTYAAHSGTAPTIYRRLYRGPGTGGSLGSIYFVATITDNTTTTYTDNFTDAELAAAGISYVDNYEPGPNSKYLAYHYGQLFLLDVVHPHRLYYSEPAGGETGLENEVLMPLAFVSTNWDDIRTAGFNRVDPQGIVPWGLQIYIPLKHTWIRKFGNDALTWSYKKTYAELGISAPYSIAKCTNPPGILGVSERGEQSGISFFNGETSRFVTSPRLDHIFKNDLNHSYIHKCRGAWDGKYYHLLYPSGTATEPDKWLAVDLTRFPDIRVAYWEDLNARSITVYDQGNNVYTGGSDGFVRQNNDTAETINVDVKSKDCVGVSAAGAPLALTPKTLREFKYALNTGGVNVTLEFYIDGTLAKWSDGTTIKTISGSGDTPQYIKNFPTNWEGYKYAVRVYGAGLSTFEIYSPWEMQLEVK